LTVNSSHNPKRGSAFIGTAKVLILAASLAATVGGWAAMSGPASAATTSAASAATTSNQANTSSGSLAATLAQVTSPSASVVQYQPAVRTRSSR
jgi:hypothetical protein